MAGQKNKSDVQKKRDEEIAQQVKKEFVEELYQCNGIIKLACEKTGISRSTYYNWCKADDDFKESVKDVNESAIDVVESKLFDKIEGIFIMKRNEDGSYTKAYQTPPDTTAIIFYLKTKARHRGYIEHSHVITQQAQPIIINTDNKQQADDATTIMKAITSDAA